MPEKIIDVYEGENLSIWLDEGFAYIDILPNGLIFCVPQEELPALLAEFSKAQISLQALGRRN